MSNHSLSVNTFVGVDSSHSVRTVVMMLGPYVHTCLGSDEWDLTTSDHLVKVS